MPGFHKSAVGRTRRTHEGAVPIWERAQTQTTATGRGRRVGRKVIEFDGKEIPEGVARRLLDLLRGNDLDALIEKAKRH